MEHIERENARLRSENAELLARINGIQASGAMRYPTFEPAAESHTMRLLRESNSDHPCWRNTETIR